MQTSFKPFFMLFAYLLLTACSQTQAPAAEVEVETEATLNTAPSNIQDNLKEWSILLANGHRQKDLIDFQHEDYFYTAGKNADWVVYKAPNGGVTSPNSHNTRTELGQKQRWTPESGGRLTGTLKVMHVSSSGDARIAAAYSVVVGQIHGDDGHENEPLKIFYKKFPGQAKGSVFWNYEINTAGDDNSGRWDYSKPVWGYDMSVVGTDSAAYPAEPLEGIELGEEFSYEVNVYKGLMHLTFKSEGHPTRTFAKSLIKSDYATAADRPEQITVLYEGLGRDGLERPEAYTGENQYFKQGAYNQTNGRAPETNKVWSTGANTYGGDLDQQYANGAYTEVWFRESSLGEGVPVKE